MIFRSRCDTELLVDLGGEAGHEGFEQDAEAEQGIYSSVDNLLASVLSLLLLVQIPWLELLEVAIAI